MASDDGNTTGVLNERLGPLLDDARRTSFFQLVSMIERMTTGSVRVGEDGPPEAEVVRFRHDPNFSFSAGDIQSAIIKDIPIEPDDPLRRTRPIVEIMTTFLGLTGAVSPLPLYIAEEVLHEDDENPVKKDFLDVFHHRLVSILYRVVSRYSPAKVHRSKGQDVWLSRMLSLAGIDSDQSGGCIPSKDLLQLVPIMARRGRGVRSLMMALNLVLREHIDEQTKITISEFAGEWVSVHKGQLFKLGQANHVLGNNTMVGVQVFERSGRFLVSIGPLGRQGRLEFTGNGLGIRKLRECVSLVLTEPIDYDVELNFTPDATRPFRLSTQEPSRLGKSTRLGANQQGEAIKLSNVGRFSSPSKR